MSEPHNLIGETREQIRRQAGDLAAQAQAAFAAASPRDILAFLSESSDPLRRLMEGEPRCKLTAQMDALHDQVISLDRALTDLDKAQEMAAEANRIILAAGALAKKAGGAAPNA